MPNPAGRPMDPIQAAVGGLWVGLGLTALVRYIHGRKISQLMSRQDEQDQLTTAMPAIK
jgi:hypothetical protein